MLTFLCNFDGKAVYIVKPKPKTAEHEQGKTSLYYSLEKVGDTSEFHCVTVNDLSFVDNENHNELWINAHCAVIDAILRVWLYTRVDNDRLSKALRQVIAKCLMQF